MDVVETILNRVSHSRLTGTVNSEALEKIKRAALRAPDHAQLRPWRFLVVSGDAREHLGALFARAKLTSDPSTGSVELAKVKAKPLRAPMIIITICAPKEHAKVPEIEQILSAGAAMQNMLQAAHAQGLGAMWRTGAMTYDEVVRTGLNVKANESIIGFLYVGEKKGKDRSVQALSTDEYFTKWRGS